MTQLTFSSASIKLVEPGSILSSSSNNTATFSVDVEKKEDLSPALSGCTQQNLNSIELTMSVDQLITSFDPLAVATLVNSLKDDSGVFKIIVLPSTKGGSTTELNISESDSLFDTIRLSFILSGLTPIIEPEEKKEEGYLPKVFTATKNQASSTGTTAAIQFPSSLKSNGVVRLNTKVMLSGLDDDDDNDELIDEDNLLIGNNDLAPPITSSRVKKQDDDCGGRKACDNCSCGRAELEQMGKKAAASTTSSCGNCSKGDAFRCAGCPFLGKPAYKAGEEMLYLDLTDDL